MKIYGYRCNNGEIEVQEAEAVEKTIYVPVEGSLPFYRDSISADEIGVKERYSSTIYFDHPALEEVREMYRKDLEQRMEFEWESLEALEKELHNLISNEEGE